MKHDVATMMQTKRGKYLLVSALSRRVRALQSGSKPMISRHEAELLDVALEEFRLGHIGVDTHLDAEAGVTQPGEESKPI